MDMSETDPSLDARIWAYVRGEGGHAERKKLEAEIGGSREAARRYSSIKLTYQRQTAHLEEGVEPSKAPKSTAKPAFKKAQIDKVKSKSLRDQTSRATKNRFGVAILILGILLVAVSGVAFLLRSNWNAEKLLIIRDSLHAFGALLGVAMFFVAERGALWKLFVTMVCIAASCGLAAMLVV